MEIKTNLLCLMLVLFSSCKNQPNPLVIGHRGAKGHVAENTLASVKKALALGVDGVEIDVFRCASGELVVFHDKTFDKLTDASGYIEETNLDSINKITVLGQEPIPTLEEVLDQIAGKVVLNIELKGSQTAVPTAELLTPYFLSGKLLPKDVFISSFDWEELALFYKVNKEVPIAILTEDDPVDAIEVARKLKAFAINPKYSSLTEKNVKKIHEEGLKIYTWTVNEAQEIERMKTLGVDAIITDFPERIFPAKQ